MLLRRGGSYLKFPVKVGLGLVPGKQHVQGGSQCKKIRGGTDVAAAVSDLFVGGKAGGAHGGTSQVDEDGGGVQLILREQDIPRFDVQMVNCITLQRAAMHVPQCMEQRADELQQGQL